MPDDSLGEDGEFPVVELTASWSPPGEFAADGGVVIERSAAVQVGDHNVQHNTLHVYGPATWTSRTRQQQVPVAGMLLSPVRYWEMAGGRQP